MTGPDDEHLPKVGEQRCYWALLSERLQFIYFDPVLQSHLEGQATSLAGQELLAFVHPEEREIAENDLRGVLKEHSLHGSITRVRFLRLSKVRRKLGFSGPYVQPFASVDRVVLDEQYMAVDITINWVAEGLVLCFIHASVDIDPQGDNDHLVKSRWTNWCGTPVMTDEQISMLFGKLLVCVPQTLQGRMFQILANKPGRPLLMSWPPEETGNIYRALVDKMDFSQGPNRESSASCMSPDAKTNCLRRFLSKEHVGPGREAESIFIPHGCIIFACHKLVPFHPPSPSTLRKILPVPNPSPSQPTTTMGYNGSSPSSYLPPSHSHPQSSQSTFYDQHQYSLPPLQSTSLPSNYSYPQQTQNSYSNYSAWNTQPTHPSVQNLRNSGYWSHSSNADHSQGAPPQLSLNPDHPQPHDYRPHSPASYSSYSPTTPSSTLGSEEPSHPSSTSGKLVPAPRRKVSPSSRDLPKTDGSVTGKEGGRVHGNRPAGVQRCTSCKATTSPEWRKGPSGKKELCNACGLRYARSRAKKEGHVPSSGGRRRKDKILKPRDSSAPPVSLSSAPASAASDYRSSSLVGPYTTSPTPSYGTSSSVPLRRVSYSTTSSDVYAHRTSPGTSSPSPPAGQGTNGNYYSHPEHAVHSSNATRTYYGSSVPSPLASVPPATMSSQSYEDERADGKRETMTSPITLERTYYEDSGPREPRSIYDVTDRRAERVYDRSYTKDFERDNRGREIVSS